MSTRIILADDHKIVRDGLRSLLMMHEGFEVIAEADCGKASVELCRKLSPDVVVMDVSMPDMNGIDATRHILEANPSIKVVALSIHADMRFVGGMLRAGASAYLLKDCAFEELVEAIQAVRNNQGYLSPSIAKVVIQNYTKEEETKETVSEFSLTAREKQVLQLLAEGKTSKEIAAVLGISTRTIETHRHQIMRKLHFHKVAELVRYAAREGLITIEKTAD